MLKLIFFGLGFVLVFEGIVYFFLANKIKKMFEILKDFDSEKIRFISSILIIAGLCLIYFTFKIYRPLI
tara:strand:- start:260 stop:466 length:207 start_codon:yes stop_codon:yes gene_type:complete